jgi:GH24 family phage-related lysozyme (muramidase)
MSIDPRLIADIQGAEGCRLTSYKDTRGNWTIGYGHLLPKPCTPEGWAGFIILQAVADHYLQEDLARSVKYITSLPEYASCDTDCRQNALTELVFNMGAGTWGEFHQTRAAIQGKNWQATHDGLLASAWAKEVQPGGFDKPGRATRIAGYFLSGAYPA